MKIFKPLKQTMIIQGYGPANTNASVMHFYQELGLIGHNGLDFSALYGFPGHPEVYFNVLGGKGIVQQVGTYVDGCKYVKIITQEGGKIYQHRYCHLWDFTVAAGDVLEGGELIAHADNTGKYTTGQHLHYDLSEMKLNGNAYAYVYPTNGLGGQVDPMPFYENVFVGDYLKLLNQQIALLTKIIETIRKILFLKVAG